MKFVLTIFFLGSLFYANSQTLPQVEYIKLEKAQDFKNAEPYVLQTVRFLYMTAVNKDNKDRQTGFDFILKWMSGTPSYSFTMTEVDSKISKGNADIVGMYVAGMIRYALENKEKASDTRSMKLEAVRYLLDYSYIPSNNLRPTKQLKKLYEANQKGELEKEFFD